MINILNYHIHPTHQETYRERKKWQDLGGTEKKGRTGEGTGEEGRKRNSGKRDEPP